MTLHISGGKRERLRERWRRFCVHLFLLYKTALLLFGGLLLDSHSRRTRGSLVRRDRYAFFETKRKREKTAIKRRRENQ